MKKTLSKGQTKKLVKFLERTTGTLGITTVELFKQAGVSHTSFNNWKSGKRRATKRVALKVTKVIGEVIGKKTPQFPKTDFRSTLDPETLEQIKHLRSQGLGWKEIKEVAGVGYATIYDFAHNKRNPKPETLKTMHTNLLGKPKKVKPFKGVKSLKNMVLEVESEARNEIEIRFVLGFVQGIGVGIGIGFSLSILRWVGLV